MDLHDTCNIGLVLGLGPYAVHDHHGHIPGRRVHGRTKYPAPAEELSLSLSLAGGPPALGKVDAKKVVMEEPVQSSPHSSTVSSYSNHATTHDRVFRPSVKRERDVGGEDGEFERNSSRVSDEEEEIAAARKKLRLTKEQSALLEESFKEHTTLNPKQKQALAKQLNLRPRQVEVWFQNRRARTKLKQTEVDCEFLKRCCESLTDENRRLQRELQELKSMKFPPPFYMQLPAATLTMCPSCERVGAGPATPAAAATGEVPGKAPFGLGPRPAHFYGHYATHSSAAC